MKVFAYFAAVVVLMILGCGGGRTPKEIAHEEHVQHLLKTSLKPMTREIAEAVATEFEEANGVFATHDEWGYPIYDYRPWELPQQEFSWEGGDTDFSVGVAFNSESHIKTAPDVEHRYLEIRHRRTTDPEQLVRAAKEVWTHFAREVEDRHPQAGYKMVTVSMWVEGQDLTMPVGRLANEAAPHIPEHPDVKWHEWGESPLKFTKGQNTELNGSNEG